MGMGLLEDNIMTTKGEWKKFTGSDEQIAELESAEKGYILRCFYSDGDETYETPIMFGGIYDDEDSETFTSKIVVAYWIIPDDPLREMKIRQAMTGQLVYIDLRKCIYPYQADPDDSVLSVIKEGRAVEIGISTCNPKWNIPNAEYSFTAFEE